MEGGNRLLLSTPVCLMLTSMADSFARILHLLKPNRRWAQFSLGTILVLVTVLCAVLAMIVVPAERQRCAVAAIEAVEGSVVYRDRAESFPTSALRRWLPARCFDEVQHVDLSSSRLSDSALTQTLWRGRLKLLSLHSPWVNGSWFDHRSAPTGVGVLEPRIRGTGGALAHLGALKGLESLHLDDADVTDVELAHLEALPRLRILGLNFTRVTDAGLAHLEGLKSLQMLGLRRTKITDAGLAHLVSLKGLEWLYLDQTQVAGDGLAHLNGLPCLRSLGLEGTQMTDSEMAHLEGLTDLRELDLSFTQITDAGLARLRGLTRLETLSLMGLEGWPAGPQRAARQEGLDTPQITDAGLVYLEQLPQLKALDLRCTHLTNDGVAQLRRALPNCKIQGP